MMMMMMMMMMLMIAFLANKSFNESR
jgi:hypothetical protein